MSSLFAIHPSNKTPVMAKISPVDEKVSCILSDDDFHFCLLNGYDATMKSTVRELKHLFAAKFTAALAVMAITLLYCLKPLKHLFPPGVSREDTVFVCKFPTML